MARKAIHRDLHKKSVDHSKAYTVIGQRGQLRVDEEAPEKVSKASKVSKKEEQPPALEAVKKETVEPELVKEEAPKTEVKTEVEPKAKKVTKKTTKKPVAKKAAKRGRLAVSKVTPKKEEESEDQLP